MLQLLTHKIYFKVNEQCSSDTSSVHIYICFCLLKSGFVSDEEVKRRETSLRDALKRDFEFKVKEGASIEIAQVRHYLLQCSLACM